MLYKIIIKIKKKIESIQMFDLRFLISKSYYSNDRAQNYLIFNPIYKTFKKMTGTETIIVRESKGFSNKIIKPPTTADNGISPKIKCIQNSKCIEFIIQKQQQNLFEARSLLQTRHFE